MFSFISSLIYWSRITSRQKNLSQSGIHDMWILGYEDLMIFKDMRMWGHDYKRMWGYIDMRIWRSIWRYGALKVWGFEDMRIRRIWRYGEIQVFLPLSCCHMPWTSLRSSSCLFPLLPTNSYLPNITSYLGNFWKSKWNSGKFLKVCKRLRMLGGIGGQALVWHNLYTPESHQEDLENWRRKKGGRKEWSRSQFSEWVFQWQILEYIQKSLTNCKSIEEGVDLGPIEIYDILPRCMIVSPT